MKTNKAIQINGRTAWIDAAKCIGILFVLMAHAQLQIPFLSDYAVYFYVPIFFVLAGFTYHAKEESYAHFCKRKARRLLLPYFGYSLFLYACFVIKDCILSRPTMTQVIQPLVGILYSRNCFYPLGSADNPTIMTIWNAPLWFLTALFLSYLLFELGMRITKRQSHRMLLYTIGCVGVGILIHDTCKILLPWSLDSVFLLESLLAFGYWLQQSKFFTKPRVQTSGYFKIAVVIVLLLLPFTMMWNGKPNLSVGEYGRSVLLGLFNIAVTSVSVLTLCYLARNQIGAGLAYIGQSALTIMSMHMFLFMFLQGGFRLFGDHIMEGNGTLAVLCQTGMVCASLAILTIVDLCCHALGKEHLCRKG